MNKTQRKEAIRELIDRYQFSYPFNAKDTETVNQLTGWSFKGYKRIKNPTWPTDLRCLAHTSDGETWEVWSWNKAIDNYGTFKNLQEAARLAIEPQMRQYAARAPNNCALCASEEYLSVDHKDIPFIVLVREYIKTSPGFIEAISNDGTGAGWYIADPTHKANWESFHKGAATYQVLCRSCNSKKGAKHDASERQA